MAGLGQRFTEKYTVPKPLIDVHGKTMIKRVVENFGDLNSYIFIVLKKHEEQFQISKRLKSLCIENKIIITDGVTEGPAASCLLAEEYLNNDPLLIVNCDQIIEDFSWKNFNSFIRWKNPDGVLGVFSSNHPKNSYVKLDESFKITEVKEKMVISSLATNGLHFWKNANDFVNSAKSMIENNERYNNEFYVGPSFNYLINKSKVILPYYFNQHIPIGTPQDLEIYEQSIR